MQAIKLLWLLQGLPRLEGLPIITRKQANALAAVTASACCKGCQQRRQRPFCYGIYTGVAAVLHNRVNSEDLTDNELDEVLNADILYNKKSYNRPTKYSR
jgi:hypothetical protein